MILLIWSRKLASWPMWKYCLFYAFLPRVYNIDGVRTSNRWPKRLRSHVQRFTTLRGKRQVMLPFGNQATMDPLQQQLVPPGLPIQQELPDQQPVLGGMMTGQTGESLLPDEGLLRRQNILTPFLGQEGMTHHVTTVISYYLSIHI